MTLILDKGLETERSVTIDTINEKPLSHVLIGTMTATLAHGDDFPAVDEFISDRKFSTVDVENMEHEFPISGEYNVILDYSVQYVEKSGRFTVSISLGWESAENE